jgi:tRNA(adenine34) deaminase
MIDLHERMMELALAEAEIAALENEVPVGAIIIHQGIIVGRDHNRREQLKDPTAHAEMLAITQAASALDSWRLDDCLLYVTLEPCPMCAGAIIQARIGTVIYGALDPKAGACESLYRITNDRRLNHRSETIGGVLAGPCGGILSNFFAQQRAKGKK